MEAGAPGSCFCGNPSIESLMGRQQAAWPMRRRSWSGYLQLRLQRLTPCPLLRAPLRRAGPTAEARQRHPFVGSAHSPAGTSHSALEGRGVGQAGGPLSRLCLPRTPVFATGSTPGVARRRATTWAWPLQAATCRGVQPPCRGSGEGAGERERESEGWRRRAGDAARGEAGGGQGSAGGHRRGTLDF